MRAICTSPDEAQPAWFSPAPCCFSAGEDFLGSDDNLATPHLSLSPMKGRGIGISQGEGIHE